MRFLIVMIIYIFSGTTFMLIALISQFLQVKKQNNLRNNSFLNIFNFKFMKRMFFLLIKGNNIKERKELLQLEFMKEKENIATINFNLLCKSAKHIMKYIREIL